ncbi:3'-5' exonuclease [Actinopolymorpha alba]|uniref:3'-5' exonuclease n=1 Tax=Actinopolymorpha alba TaxID=533267 RepID=UPI0003643A98|nr:3'-5' exonuclease [Actinopolymorpha alba]
MTASTWYADTRIGFDLETTEANPEEARIVTASVITVRPGARPETLSWLADPGVDIPDEAAAIHGITTEYAKDHGNAAELVVSDVAAVICHALRRGIPVVAYNASYDFTVLDRELARYDLGGLVERLGSVKAICPVIDPFVIDRALDKYRKGKRTLTAACQQYQVTLAGAHDSSADALAAVRLATVLAAHYPEEVGDIEPAELHKRQIVWHAERQKDFAAYLRRSGKDATDVDGSWPIRLRPESKAA